MSNSKKILVADDDVELLNTIKKGLEIEGFEVITVANGKEALKASLSEHPDLIVIDEIMPEMTGNDMVNELRRDEWGANVPIVMLTNIDNTSSINLALVNGVSDYLVKSDLHMPEIIQIIRSKLA